MTHKWLRSHKGNVNDISHVRNYSQQTQNICITFIERRPNVFDVGLTLYKCYTNILCLLGWTTLYEHILLSTWNRYKLVIRGFVLVLVLCTWTTYQKVVFSLWPLLAVGHFRPLYGCWMSYRIMFSLMPSMTTLIPKMKSAPKNRQKWQITWNYWITYVKAVF